MKKLLVFEIDEFFDLIKEIMKGIFIEEITTNVKDEFADGEEIKVDCLDLKIKNPLGHGIKAITDIVHYSDIRKCTDNEDFIIVSIELTDLAQAISDVTGTPVIESYEFFEANLNGDFKEHIAFHLE